MNCLFYDIYIYEAENWPQGSLTSEKSVWDVKKACDKTLENL